MIILGVNGWYDRGHDASACIVKDGELIAGVEEERLNRQKHSYDTMPLLSVAWCLTHCNLQVEDVDAVAVGWDIAKLYDRHRSKLPFDSDEGYLDILFPKKYFGERRKKIPVYFINHHLAHAASTFYLSGLESALVFVIDGQGEDAATTLWEGTSNKLKQIIAFPVSLSLGYFFELVSSFLGFSTTHAGKTMGLAAYGKSPDIELFTLDKDGYGLAEPFNLVADGSELDEQSQLFAYWGRRLEHFFGSPNPRNYYFCKERGKFLSDAIMGTREPSIAALAQKELERVVLHLVKTYTQRYDQRNLCLSGGVALNCSCNGKVLLSGLVDDMFVQPASHDAGVAIGAALYVANQHNKLKKKRLMRADIGPSYEDSEIVDIIRSLDIKARISDNVAHEAADLIARGKTVGWFQGGAEIGPRALGNRSILVDPSSVSLRDKTNNVKGREIWRPLSPSVLREKSTWLLGKGMDIPFMLFGLSVLDQVKSKIPAVVHIDGTARPQTVASELGRYHQVISIFEGIRGVPLILNTSFNGPGEPIVCTPYNAIHCFFDRPIDALVMGNCVIEKE